MNSQEFLSITGASEHNLRSVSVTFPKNSLVVVSGVSGSGKSSLVYDVLFREAESRYLGAFSSFARQFIGKMKRPDVEKIEGLAPAIAIGQQVFVSNPRSTVGTITGIYDSLRLLFARAGKIPAGMESFLLSRSLFSFNSPEGACPACNGIGVEDHLDPDLLVADDSRSLRQGALVITAPNGYIIYSQVTLDVLDQVCRAEGFHIDIPWRDLTPEQKHIVLYGSDKIEIPYGKHPLESRMKWSGITAKPREMGFYKGILPVMEVILRRDRNKNILRFVRTTGCKSCHGQRLNDRALNVKISGYSIADLADMPLDDLAGVLHRMAMEMPEREIAAPVISRVTKHLDLLKKLGLSYLTCSRTSASLSGGEAQRLRLAAQAGLGLSGMLCIFDEPSAGMHPHDTDNLIGILKTLRDQGNTVVVVEHEEAFFRHADWLIDIGPGPGIHGGEVLFSGTLADAGSLAEPLKRKSRTLSFLFGLEKSPWPAQRRTGTGWLMLEGAEANNLKNIDAGFRLGTLNVITGVAGAGKSSLAIDTLGPWLRNRIHHTGEPAGKCRTITGWEGIGKVVSIDQSPIGRTPRSNPATYTGLSDHIRDLFASQPLSRELVYDKSRFSFNTPGGRCETCEGAGYLQTGMHYLGSMEILCERCEGRRFDPSTLSVTYKGKNISEVLELTVSEALDFFREEKKILHFLNILESLGLGYLTLGQRSSTLSGGEAQRVKLASELARPAKAHTLYIMDEPTTGLHQADVAVLLAALDRLIRQGHTIILIEHHTAVIAAADHVVDLGPGCGRDGGKVVFSGTPEALMDCPGSLTGLALKDQHPMTSAALPPAGPACGLHDIVVRGASVNNLKNITVTIPGNQLTVITGVSGSGKTSLAFDTIWAEGQNRFLESFSPYVRSRLGMQEQADFEEITGLTPTFAISQAGAGRNPRSTVGTITGIYDQYRLLFSRAGSRDRARHDLVPAFSGITSSLFSFNHHLGACPSCDGLGYRITCDPERLITYPERPIGKGAMDGSKTGRFYGDPDGQYMATLRKAAQSHGFDYDTPWQDLSGEARSLALYGTGEEVYEVDWSFRRGDRTGIHRFSGPWTGLVSLVNEEFARKHADHRGDSMLALMQQVACPACQGTRLRAESLGFYIGGLTISGLAGLSVLQSIDFFDHLLGLDNHRGKIQEVIRILTAGIMERLGTLERLGLGYMTLDRASATLSAGESKRIRLAAQIGSGLTGLTYILDEPTTGLHPRDTTRLMACVRELQRSGNTVILVEHDPEVILAADHMIDMGPGAGMHGGRILATGSPEQVMLNPESVTGPFLQKQLHHHPRSKRQEYWPSTGLGLHIEGAFAHNLKGFDLFIPIGGMTAITGVSGSGKSTLMFDVILASHEQKRPAGCRQIAGFGHFSKVTSIRQRPGFQSAMATVATFSGIFERIRDLFAALPGVREAGIGKNSFSYMSSEGRCPACEGSGQVSVSMDFLPDVVSVCEVCNGRRFRDEILQYRYRGMHIGGILDQTLSDAGRLFADDLKITSRITILEKVGLGYLRLGQSLNTLSGGESQRLTLATELMSPTGSHALYLFDEPSSGLHMQDVGYLLALFRELSDAGHTLLIIEHDPQIIAEADRVIELGPEGGDPGGYLLTGKG